MLPHGFFILFLFALGACIGSFLNVVVWRLPRGESLITPPSHCPGCGHKLAWHDNVPVVGWIWLKGKCRYCAAPISARYPIVEAITGLLFVFYYVAFFIYQQGPCAPDPAMIPDELGFRHPRALNIAGDWPMYGLYMYLLASLLAASLIDIETFTIPAPIFWWVAGVGIVVHTIIDSPTTPGALDPGPVPGAIAAGGGIGLLVSIALLHLKLIPLSFSENQSMLGVTQEQLRLIFRAGRQRFAPVPNGTTTSPGARRSLRRRFVRQALRRHTRREMSKEILFLLPPLVLAGTWAALVQFVPPIRSIWQQAMVPDWARGGLGAVLGALVGAFTIWLTRILGSIGFGREAMGLGDVHLMFGVGAVLGAGGAVLTFFLAPFFGLAIAIWRFATGRGRETPYGPFLGLATGAVMLFYCPIAMYLKPGFQGVVAMLQDLAGRH